MNSLIGSLEPYSGEPLVIGLVNNMAHGAMEATHFQFFAALEESGYNVVLRHFTLKNADEAYPGYQPIDAIFDQDVAGLIVTGMEPSESDLRHEGIWRNLIRLHDYCEERGLPVIWSCLSAHAVVLHRDNINRQRLETKLSGLFVCVRSDDYHPLIKGMPAEWECPHSRYNTLPVDKLMTAGYKILSHAGQAGADIFACDDTTPFVFFQGHPEYQPDTLLREFVRDMRRYLRSELPRAPERPCGYEGEEVVDTFLASAANSADSVPPSQAIRFRWQTARRVLFSNWIEIVVSARHARRTHAKLKLSMTPCNTSSPALQR